MSTQAQKNNKKVVKAKASTKPSYQKNILEWRKEIHEEIHQQVEQHPDMNFAKRRYHSVKEFSSHCWYLAERIKHAGLMWDITKSVTRSAISTKAIEHRHDNTLVSSAFRERLMLAVTSVNACNACSYAHARAALTEGLDENEIDALLSGHFENCPKEEQPALLYAQHWAEAEGKPDDETRSKMIKIYGKNKTQAVEFTLGSIRIGNYIGNTLEYFEVTLENRKLARKNSKLLRNTF